MNIDFVLFFIVTFSIIYWGRLVLKKSSFKSVYFLYYFLNLTIFYGPLVYYQLGLTAYSNAFSQSALNEFAYLSLTIIIINIIIYYSLFLTKSFLFVSFFNSIQYSSIRNKKLVGQFYWGVIILTLIYFVAFYKSFPLAVLFSTGELGERLDTTGAIPMYITFSAFSMIMVPTAFFYLSSQINNRLINFLLFIFTIFCLSAGGNKGIVSFFLIFYSIFRLKGNGLIKYSILFLVLIFIYAIFKGITSIDNDSIAYLMESPFRRLFVAQGSGYIVRIDMINNDLFENGEIIKKQVFTQIYGGSGSSPTHFTGDILVKYGYLFMYLAYLVFSIIFTKLLITVDLFNGNSKNVFLLWVFFFVIFLFCNAEISLATGIRLFFVLINFVLLKFTSRVELN